MNDRIQRPVAVVWRRTFATHGDGRAQAERAEDRIENVAAHITECRRAEIDALAPVHRMVNILHKRARLRHPDPVIPIQRRGNRVRLVLQGSRVAPLLLAPGVNFLDFADGAAAYQLHRRSILLGGVNLDAHLRDQMFLVRDCFQLADLVDAVRERFLHICRKPQLHGGHRLGRVHVIGRADADRVQSTMLLLQHLAPIGVDLGLWRTLPDLIQFGRIHFRDADQLHLGMAQEDIDGDEGHAAGAESAQPQLAAWRRGE